MDINFIFIGALLVESGIILIELSNQKSVGNVTIRFSLKTQQNLHRIAQLKRQSQLSRN